MKKLKKLSALVLALMLALVMSTAWAATALNNGIEGDTNDDASIQDNTITIMKELKVYNTDGKDIYLPTVGYTYTITSASVTSGTTVTDSHDHTGYVYPGNTSALSGTYSVDFSPATASGYKNDGTVSTVTITQPTAAASGGTSYYGGFQITVDPMKVADGTAAGAHAGIFRYKIVEAENSTNTLAKAGVVHQDSSEYESDRYLDIYIRRAVADDNASTDYVVYGYVLWCPEEEGDPVAEQDQDTSITKTPNVSKTNGYVGDTGGDEYNTYNLEVTKTIEGQLAEKNHQFPFQVVFTSPNATAATIYYKATNGIPTDNTTATLSSSETTTIGALTNASTLKLTDSGSVIFYGIPAGVTATVQENNDTYDVYTATAEITANTAQTYVENQVQAGASATIISGLDNATTTESVGSENTKVEWTNTISVVSPTGYVVRYAPYALIMIAGIVLFIIAKKHRKTTKEEE